MRTEYVVALLAFLAGVLLSKMQSVQAGQPGSDLTWNVGYHCPYDTALVGVKVVDAGAADGLQLLCSNHSMAWGPVMASGLPGSADRAGFDAHCLGHNSFVVRISYAVPMRGGPGPGGAAVGVVSLQCDDGDLLALDFHDLLQRGPMALMHDECASGTVAAGWVVQHGGADGRSGLRLVCMPTPALPGGELDAEGGDGGSYYAEMALGGFDPYELDALVGEGAHALLAGDRSDSGVYALSGWDGWDLLYERLEREAAAAAEAEGGAPLRGGAGGRAAPRGAPGGADEGGALFVGCAPGCVECNAVSLACYFCERGSARAPGDSSICVPCGVEHCSDCSAASDPAHYCSACEYPYVLGPYGNSCLPREEADRQFSALWAAQEAAAAATAAADAAAQACALARPCTGCRPGEPSACGACEPGYTLYGSECVMFNASGAWQRHFYGFDGRTVDVINFEAGSAYRLLAMPGAQVNVQFDGILVEHEAVAVTRGVGLLVGRHALRAELRLHEGQRAGASLLVTLNGGVVHSGAEPAGTANTTRLPPTEDSPAITLHIATSAQTEELLLESPDLSAVVRRRGRDLSVHLALPRRPAPSDVSGLLARTVPLAGPAAARRSMWPVTFAHAPDYQETTLLACGAGAPSYESGYGDPWVYGDDEEDYDEDYDEYGLQATGEHAGAAGDAATAGPRPAGARIGADAGERLYVTSRK